MAAGLPLDKKTRVPLLNEEGYVTDIDLIAVATGCSILITEHVKIVLAKKLPEIFKDPEDVDTDIIVVGVPQIVDALRLIIRGINRERVGAQRAQIEICLENLRVLEERLGLEPALGDGHDTP